MPSLTGDDLDEARLLRLRAEAAGHRKRLRMLVDFRRARSSVRRRVAAVLGDHCEDTEMSDAQTDSDEDRRAADSAERVLRRMRPAGKPDSGDPAVALLSRAELGLHAAQDLVRSGGSVSYLEREQLDEVEAEMQRATEAGEYARVRLLRAYQQGIRHSAAQIRAAHRDLEVWWDNHPLHQLVLFVATQCRTAVYNLTDGDRDAVGVSPTKQWRAALTATLRAVDALERIDDRLAGAAVPPDAQLVAMVAADTLKWSDEARRIGFNVASCMRYLETRDPVGRPTPLAVLREWVGVLGPASSDASSEASSDDPLSDANLAALLRSVDTDEIIRALTEFCLVPEARVVSHIIKKITAKTEAAAVRAELDGEMKLNFAIVGVARGVHAMLVRRWPHLAACPVEHMWDRAHNTLYDTFAALVAMQVSLNDKTSSFRADYKGNDRLLEAKMYQTAFMFERARVRDGVLVA